MDFAFYENGYVYHTYHDVAEIIPMGTFQNAGDNMLAITTAAANSPDLPDTSVSRKVEQWNGYDSLIEHNFKFILMQSLNV